MHNKSNKEKHISSNEYYLTHNPFNTEACTDPKEYVEREKEISKFEKELDLISFSGCSGKRIIGRKGIGKTSLVNMYLKVASKRSLKTAYVTVPNSGRKFMQKLLAATVDAVIRDDGSKGESLRNRYGEYIRRSNLYPETVFEKWTQVIDEIKPKPVIVAIDETDNLPRIPQITHLFNNYIFSHTQEVMPILCMLPGTHEKIVRGMGAFADRFPIVIRLHSFSNNELLQLFEKRLKLARTKIQPPNRYWPFTKKAVEKILDHAEGVPRYLIDIARESLNYGIETHARQINDKHIEKAAIRAERGNLIGVWESLTTSEKQTLKEIARCGGEVKLDNLTTIIKKDKTWIWRSVNELVERGLVEKIGEAKKDVVYKLKIAPELVKDLGTRGEL